MEQVKLPEDPTLYDLINAQQERCAHLEAINKELVEACGVAEGFIKDAAEQRLLLTISFETFCVLTTLKAALAKANALMEKEKP